MNTIHFAGASNSRPIQWCGAIAVALAVLFPSLLRAQTPPGNCATVIAALKNAENHSPDSLPISSTSLACYEQQAQQGEPVAEYVLAVMYYDTGVPTQTASSDINVAPFPPSVTSPGDAMFSPADKIKARMWFEKAAIHVDGPAGWPVAADSQYMLGNIYQYGQGTPVDLQKALAWYEKSAAHGNSRAPTKVSDLEKQLSMLTAEAGPRVVGAVARPSDGHDAAAQASAQSAAEWQQEHQAKIDELTQEIADREQQAEQDDANAEQAAAQVQQNASANVSGPGGGFLALGNAVEGAMNAGLAEKMRQDASEERRQAQEEREQLAELGAEQPPVAQNNSEMIALTRTQTQMIQSGNTIEGALNRAQNNMQAAQQAAAEHREQVAEQQEAQRQAFSARTAGSGMSAANVGAVPQVPPSGPVRVIFRGLLSPVPGQAVVTDTLNKQSCPPDCSFSFPPGNYTVHFIAQANPQSIFRAFEGMCAGGGGTAPRTPGNSGACALGSPPSQATTITVLVDPASPSDQTSTASGSASSGSSSSQTGATPSGATAPQTGGSSNSGSGQFTSPMASSCIRMFNDSSMYGWVALQNTCSHKMTVTFEGRNGSGGVFGTLDLAPGQSYNTGFSPSEIAAVGGIYTYPCPYGYIPTNMNGQAITAPVAQFTCKYRGY